MNKKKAKGIKSLFIHQSSDMRYRILRSCRRLLGHGGRGHNLSFTKMCRKSAMWVLFVLNSESVLTEILADRPSELSQKYYFRLKLFEDFRLSCFFSNLGNSNDIGLKKIIGHMVFYIKFPTESDPIVRTTHKTH